MNIFKHELKAYRKSTFIWTISLVLLVIFFMSMFPSISREIDGFNKLLEGFPEALRKAIGLQIGTLGTIIGFYSYIFLYISLTGAIQAMNLGVSIVSKESREKTADFLLTKPVTRTKILSSKILAALTSLLITNIIYIVTASIMAYMVKSESFNVKVFLMISLTLLFIQLIFLSIGILISVLFSKLKSVVTVSLGTVFMFFIFGMVAATEGKDIGRYFSPFKYFDTTYINQNGSYEASYLVTGVIIVIFALGISSYIFKKKDIHSV